MDHSQTEAQPVITRFAPSPTGFMHIGGVRTALFAYLYAKKMNGEFILRIEDTDKAREVEGSREQIMRSLRWLGIEWEYGPDKPHPQWDSALQSERKEAGIYHEYAQRLIDKGLAYPDTYTAEEIAAFREQADAEKRPFLYRLHRPETFEEWDGTKPLRLKTPEIKRYTWQDAVRGELTAGEEALDDFILIKADGYPTYNFAHIVDDAEMNITHVMRGEEFVSSTPKFLSLYDALELPWPTFVTLPPIMGPDGKKKLSKRDGAKDLLEYDEEGYLFEAMRNFLALIGWNPGTDQELFFTEDDLVQAFSLEKIQKSGGAFNEEKLQWMNKEHLQKLPVEEQISYVTDTLPEMDAEILSKLAPSILERIHTKTEILQAESEGEYAWAFADITYDTDKLKWKQDDSAADAKPRLERALALLSEADFAAVETIKAALWDYAEEVGKGQVLWPLRVALTGRDRSPDPFTCAHILGKETTLARVATSIEKLQS